MYGNLQQEWFFEETFIHGNELGYGFSEIGGNYDSVSAKKPNAYRDDFNFNRHKESFNSDSSWDNIPDNNVCE